MMVRVLLVDDHKLVRVGIRALLEEAGGIQVVGEASTGEEALRQARTASPDMVLMDVNMPGMGGLEATRKLRRQDPDVGIIVLSVHGDGPFPSRLLEAGAAGYLTKGCDREEMVQAIHAVRRGERYICAEVAQQMVLRQYEGERPPIETLSPRELQVMLMVSRGSNLREISDKLCLSPKTISTYRCRLMKKLGAHTDVELTHLALRHGLIEQSLVPN